MKKNILISLLWIIPAMAFGQNELTLEKCRELALSYNPLLKAQGKIVESSEANMLARKKEYYPFIDLNGNYSFLQEPVKVLLNNQSFEGTRQVYSFTAPLVQNVYQGSLVKNKNELARFQNEYAVSEKNTTEDYLIMQAELAFWSGIYGKELHSLSNQYKETVDGLVKVIKDKVENEIISRNDLLLIEVRQNEAELFQLMTLNSLEVSMMDLYRIIGYPVDTLIDISGDLGIRLDTMVTSQPEQVFEIRPEVVSQQKLMEMQEANSDIVKSAYLPKVFVGVIPEYGAPNTNLGGTDPMYNTAVMAGVNVPLVRWGQKSQDVRKEMSLVEADKFRLQELKDEITLELNLADYQLQEAVKRVDLTRNSLVKAEENLRIMTDRYLEGLTSILEVLDAQQYWQRSYKDLLDSELNYKQAWILYRKAYGIL